MEETPNPPERRRSLWQRGSLRVAIALGAAYFLLLIPDAEPPRPEGAGRTPFTWNQARFWAELNARFEAARQSGCSNLSDSIKRRLSEARSQLDTIASTHPGPESALYSDLESNLFTLASELAACPDQLPQFIELYRRLRTLVKNTSRNWDVNAATARDRLYRLLYGGRAALEEILLQSPANSWPAVIPGHDEPSQTPFASLLGIRIHSGDVLVSRGTAPTSSLIARGNDYPGNFSHVALVHIDPATRDVSLVEAHIESGVSVSTMERYLNDRKYRLMVLRLRSDLPRILQDPGLPHKAAAGALKRALENHIPYDFSMDHNDPSRLFCSEVASEAYREFGIALWSSRSFISGPGVTSWLAAFGVREFETQKPADLEFDPQLRVIAEWRDPASLLQEHLDNAVVDAMLERADDGQGLDYSLPMLPLTRILKGYSTVLNWMGKVGPIPEGMNATAALRNKRFTKDHQRTKARLVELAQSFETRHGYTAPHAVLLELARTASP